MRDDTLSFDKYTCPEPEPEQDEPVAESDWTGTEDYYAMVRKGLDLDQVAA